MTKQEILNYLEKDLKNNPKIRVNVKDFPTLRNGKYHPYELGYDNVKRAIFVYPFSGSSTMWLFDGNKLTKDELFRLTVRVEEKIMLKIESRL